MNTKTFLFSALVAALGFAASDSASAASGTQSASYAPGLIIPDNGSGVSDTETFSFPGAATISSVQVFLNISGGWNGDYYAWLRHGTTGFAVLLNRAGVSGGSAYGYGDNGFNITLDDSASNGDIHFYQGVVNPQGAALTGLWQPDGRNVDPNIVSGLTPRSAMLGSFGGLDPNGDWTLFVADDSPGGIGTLAGWGLTVTVPEPGTLGFLALAGIGLLAQHLRNKIAA